MWRRCLTKGNLVGPGLVMWMMGKMLNVSLQTLSKPYRLEWVNSLCAKEIVLLSFLLFCILNMDIDLT